MNSLSPAASLAGRVFLSLIFITSGWAKIGGYSGTAQYMESVGVPSALLPLAILVEFGGGLMILFGFYTRIAAIALAGFTLVAGYLFHFQPDDQMQMINFWKNVAITGGFLMLFAHGAGAWSVDAWMGGGKLQARHSAA